MKQQRKRVKIEMSIDLLCALWNNRENQEDLDTIIEKFLIAGLKAEGILRQ
jgi:hypothetical protein